MARIKYKEAAGLEVKRGRPPAAQFFGISASSSRGFGCGQHPLDTQNPSSYTRTVKKEVLINQRVLLYPLF
jgi:hypothetical protein